MLIVRDGPDKNPVPVNLQDKVKRSVRRQYTESQSGLRD